LCYTRVLTRVADNAYLAIMFKMRIIA